MINLKTTHYFQPLLKVIISILSVWYFAVTLGRSYYAGNLDDKTLYFASSGVITGPIENYLELRKLAYDFVEKCSQLNTSTSPSNVESDRCKYRTLMHFSGLLHYPITSIAMAAFDKPFAGKPDRSVHTVAEVSIPGMIASHAIAALLFLYLLMRSPYFSSFCALALVPAAYELLVNTLRYQFPTHDLHDLSIYSYAPRGAFMMLCVIAFSSYFQNLWKVVLITLILASLTHIGGAIVLAGLIAITMLMKKLIMKNNLLEWDRQLLAVLSVFIAGLVWVKIATLSVNDGISFSVSGLIKLLFQRLGLTWGIAIFVAIAIATSIFRNIQKNIQKDSPLLSACALLAAFILIFVPCALIIVVQSEPIASNLYNAPIEALYLRLFGIGMALMCYCSLFITLQILESKYDFMKSNKMKLAAIVIVGFTIAIPLCKFGPRKYNDSIENYRAMMIDMSRYGHDSRSLNAYQLDQLNPWEEISVHLAMYNFLNK